MMVFTITPTTVFAAGTDDINPAGVIEDWSTPDTSWFHPDNKQKKYTLTTASELVGWISIMKDRSGGFNFKDTTIELGNDIILNDTTDENWVENANKWNGEVASSQAFRGTFDGKGHSIIGLYSETGLIGSTSYGATIQNLIIDKAVIDTVDSRKSAGAIVSALTGEIKNCTVKNSVIESGFKDAGAIVGTGNQSTVSNCKVINCSITSQSSAGGIVGTGRTVSDCSVDENSVVVSKHEAGGIAESANDITNCDNAASVTGGTAASGVLASLTASKGSIEDCNNTGDVTSTGSLAGGIIGNVKSHHLSISNCTNSGNIKAETANTDNGGVGGIAGAITTSVTIENCSSTGIIEGKTNVGGIVGNSKIIMGNTYESGKSNAVNNCTVSGEVIGETNVGGLIGNNVVVDGDEYKDTSVQNNVLLPSITVIGTANVGALIGNNVAQTDTGTIKNNIWPQTIGEASGAGAGSSDVALSKNSAYDENGQLLDPGKVEGSDGSPIQSVCEMVGHNAVKTEAKAATCTEDGNIEYWTCDTCGKIFSNEALSEEITEEKTVVKATGHGEIELKNAKDATCTEEGYTGDKVCKVCGEVLEQGKAIPKLAHSYGEWKQTKAPDCTNPGTEERICADCQNKEIREIPALGHGETELKNAKDATCTEEGYTGDKVCKVCGEVLEQGKVIPKLAHSYKDGKCTVCGVADPNYKPTEPGDGDTNAPETSDSSNMTLWIALLFVSGTGLLGATVYNRKKK